jgi:hypothetical protein
MLFPLMPDEEASLREWRIWLSYLESLPQCSPSVVSAMHHADRMIAQKSATHPPPAHAALAARDQNGQAD